MPLTTNTSAAPGNHAVEKRSTACCAGKSLEIAQWIVAPPTQATIVFLHEGLGSVSMWRDFPRALALATGCNALAYSRYGYGQSDVINDARDARYMHDEALNVMPELLQKLNISAPILYGHSDGASIALIHAGAGHAVRGMVVEAAHVFVEPISLVGISAAATSAQETDLLTRLARHHREPAKTFWSWHDVWMSPEFRDWNISKYLPNITAPTLVIQGADDAYGSMAQVDAIVGAVSGRSQQLRLADCGHAPHREKSQQVIETATAFVRNIIE